MRDGYGCEVAWAAGELRMAEVTDHIIPLSKGGAPYDDRNLMAMSHYYHDKKRGAESHGYVIDSEPGDGGLVPVDRSAVFAKLIKGEGAFDL